MECRASSERVNIDPDGPINALHGRNEHHLFCRTPSLRRNARPSRSKKSCAETEVLLGYKYVELLVLKEKNVPPAAVCMICMYKGEVETDSFVAVYGKANTYLKKR